MSLRDDEWPHPCAICGGAAEFGLDRCMDHRRPGVASRTALAESKLRADHEERAQKAKRPTLFGNIHQNQDMPPGAYCVETCLDNDLPCAGSVRRWSWANPTNTRFPVEYGGIRFISVEALWQGAKVFAHDGFPDMKAATLRGQWRRAKRRRPYGHWGGPGNHPITSAGEARRRIYVPAYLLQIEQWLQDPEVAEWVAVARQQELVHVRDWDIGMGLDNVGPMSHGWLLAHYLNNGEMPK